ncbi:MAG TPA: NlpC/P60 family protein [Acidimicrobiales bacterium]|nr:NlpC/P60 family protein [Acidimicrobiales bacterium]
MLAAVTVAAAVVAVVPTASGASQIRSERARAKALYNQIQRMNGRVDLLSQRYDLAQIKLHKITNEIVNTKAIVRAIRRHERSGDAQLRAAAVFAYVTNGAASASNPLFSSKASSIGATNVYSQLAQGNIASTLASLKSDRVRLTQERSVLAAEDRSAASAAAAAARALHEAQSIQSALQRALNQVKGQIAQYIAAVEAAAERRAAGAIHRSHPGRGFPAPPPDSRANIAIDAAFSYIGVPYVWGGASRHGVDCSGLIMLAYAAAGIFFPHYSGAMYDDTVRVPLWDLRPGDLLFWGWHGDQHVAMYIGHHDMIEAEMTGTRVHVVPVRFGWGFAGAGRPRV